MRTLTCGILAYVNKNKVGPTCLTLSHTYAVKSPLVTMVRSKFAPKSTPSRGPIGKPQYLPHPWTRPTYGAKRLLDAICRFSTMHWTDRPTDRPTDPQTDRPTDRTRESLMTIGRCAPRATRPNNTNFCPVLQLCISQRLPVIAAYWSNYRFLVSDQKNGSSSLGRRSMSNTVHLTCTAKQATLTR